jgi:hypothetical protein
MKHEVSFAESCRVLLLAFVTRYLIKNKQNVAVPRRELENFADDAESKVSFRFCRTVGN